jgi:NADPH:quinone reductase-like Zn-dependent oxidoreductase
MKAIVYKEYGSPEVLQLKEIEKPFPRDGEILIKIMATTVTAADIRARSFTVPRSVWLPARLALGIRQPKKAILGAELAGEVEAVGKNVKKFKAGDLVFAASLEGFGAYAEYICLREDGPISFKPENTTFEEAAAIPIGARTALYFLQRANIQKGQKVLIYGASGSVGSFAVQIAKHLGAEVDGVCSTSNLEWVKSLGADRVMDYRAEDFLVEEDAYDLIFETVNKSAFKDCMKWLKKGGTYINVTEPLPSPQMLWTKMTEGKKILLSRNAPETPEALDYLKEMVEAGKLKVKIDRVYPLEEIRDAHRYVDGGHKKGNVAVAVNRG